MSAKTINKLNDKLSKMGESFTVNIYDNGFMLEAVGYDKKNDYVTAKLLCNNLEELLSMVREACQMQRDN